MPIHGPFRGSGNGGGRVPFTPDDSPFADVSARDTWATANPDQLFNNSNLFTQIVVGDELQNWAGADTPASYDPATDAGDWHVEAGLNAAQLAVLNSLRVQADRLISNKSFEVPPGTVYIGQGTALSAAIRSVHLRSDVTGNTALILAQLYDDTNGFSRAFTYSGDTVSTVDLNDPAGTDNADNAEFSFIATADELLTKMQIPTTEISQNIAFAVTIRTGSHAGTVAFHLEDTLTTDSSGVATVDLRASYNPILVDSGTDLFVTVNCDGMIGKDQGGGVFVPNAIITRTVVSRVEIPVGEDFTTALLAKLNGISSGATVGVIVEDEGSELPTNTTRLNFTGDGVEATGTGAEKTITIPGGIAGLTVQDEGTGLSTTVTTLNFTGDGVQAIGSGDTIRIEVTGGVPTPPQADHTNYIDVTVNSNASSVDIVNAVNSDDLNPAVTLETFTGNAYIQILQSMAHTAFTSITIGGLNQLGAFTVVENARVISGQAYRQYVTTNLITDALSGATITMGGAT